MAKLDHAAVRAVPLVEVWLWIGLLRCAERCRGEEKRCGGSLGERPQGNRHSGAVKAPRTRSRVARECTSPAGVRTRHGILQDVRLCSSSTSGLPIGRPLRGRDGAASRGAGWTGSAPASCRKWRWACCWRWPRTGPGLPTSSRWRKSGRAGACSGPGTKGHPSLSCRAPSSGTSRASPIPPFLLDLDELDLIPIEPLPAWVWYRDMADCSAERTAGGQGLAAWNRATRSAGTRPRWLTSIPCDSAQTRTAFGS